MPPKSNPKLPSFASIRVMNLPPGLKSFSARGACQSSEALHHRVMCSGFVQYFHTFSTGALMVDDTVITTFSVVCIRYDLLWSKDVNKSKEFIHSGI
jgi:hypothetical protein